MKIKLILVLIVSLSLTGCVSILKEIDTVLTTMQENNIEVDYFNDSTIYTISLKTHTDEEGNLIAHWNRTTKMIGGPTANLTITKKAD